MSQPENRGPDEVPITIDKKPKKTSSPTTGRVLYELGEVRAGYDLFRETRGQGDDEFIRNDDAQVALNPGDQFYSAQSSLNPGA